MASQTKEQRREPVQVGRLRRLAPDAAPGPGNVNGRLLRPRLQTAFVDYVQFRDALQHQRPSVARGESHPHAVTEQHLELVRWPSLLAQRPGAGAGFRKQHLPEQFLLSLQRELGRTPAASLRGARRHAGGTILYALS